MRRILVAALLALGCAQTSDGPEAAERSTLIVRKATGVECGVPRFVQEHRLEAGGPCGTPTEAFVLPRADDGLLDGPAGVYEITGAMTGEKLTLARWRATVGEPPPERADAAESFPVFAVETWCVRADTVPAVGVSIPPGKTC